MPAVMPAVSIAGMKWLLKLRRIYQPRNPLFWLMLVINALSYALGWIVQNRALNTMGMLLVGGFASVNAVVGTWLMWRLLQTDPEAKPLPKLPL
jgi:hypothetical protein